jgi:hypothetical protein
MTTFPPESPCPKCGSDLSLPVGPPPAEVEELVASTIDVAEDARTRAAHGAPTKKAYAEALDEAATALTSLSQENERQKALIGDYEDSMADKRRLAREIDVALCGEEDAAPQASWCDLVKVAEMKRAEITSLSLRVKELEEALKQYEAGWEADRNRYFEARNALFQFNNPPDPKLLREIADEIDCGVDCSHSYTEWDTNAHVCSRSNKGECAGEKAYALKEFADAIEVHARTVLHGDGDE